MKTKYRIKKSYYLDKEILCLYPHYTAQVRLWGFWWTNVTFGKRGIRRYTTLDEAKEDIQRHIKYNEMMAKYRELKKTQRKTEYLYDFEL